MGITIRNKDSVTGIVLFIFNLLQEYKDRSAMIEQGDLISYLKVFGKSESSIRMGLSRMSRSKVIKKVKKDNDIYYVLDEDGNEYIDIFRRGLKNFQLKYKKRKSNNWDFNWNLYIFKDFKKSEVENTDLIEILTEMGYAEIELNVWVSPYNMGNQMDLILNEKEVEYLNINGEINTKIDISKFLKKEFNLKKLKEEYNKLISMIDENNEIIKDKELKTKELLPLLGYTGWEFYSIVTEDPFLPNNILEDWIGDRAVKLFFDYRRKLFNEIAGELFEKN
ncbi:PaaX family transcriptional regulator C-terminal domain-containing protein [Halanaerobium kushneri]|uniref:Transcriptional regulator, PaaX family n=1 Tax=Halanaerobium kushneri TaxID=56779 RepID=A0A1N6YWJ5_9FIRM|nr:PaaX family transcriptional regulator C-terminal domain-containing protein [Halanaerobium kushneri]SIR18926.1 transcriptional regulator, PaaX family [Halanaerobium kushneri]